MDIKCKKQSFFLNLMIIISFLIVLPSFSTVYAENTEPTPDFVIKIENTGNSGKQGAISSETEKTDNAENANDNMIPMPSAVPSTTEIPDTESNSNPISEFHKGWNLHGDDWYYLDSDDQNSYHKGWLYAGGKWYWLDPETGIMTTGLQEIGDSKFYFASSGAMRTGWVLDDSNWYWFNNSGYIKTGWLYTGGSWYWLDPETGIMATGLRNIEDDEYYFYSSGSMASNCWINLDNSNIAHFSSSGYLDLKGIQTSNGIQVTGKDGGLVHGWTYINGHYYLFSEEGVMLIGWQQVNDDWYYMDEQGCMLTGWLHSGNDWYWLNNSGAMQKGWKFIGGNWYYFNLENGKMLSNGWQYIGKVDYKFNSSGAMVGCWMNVPCYNQFPELPTGCESVALTNLLNYYGFGLAKTTIASSYLPLTSGGNFVTAFSGNPFTGTGGTERLCCSGNCECRK